jgi:hypothetical protein
MKYLISTRNRSLTQCRPSPAVQRGPPPEIKQHAEHRPPLRTAAEQSPYLFDVAPRLILLELYTGRKSNMWHPRETFHLVPFKKVCLNCQTESLATVPTLSAAQIINN